jgi:hypothetical protein
MFTAIGHAVSNWGKVELQMIRLFAQATGMTPVNAASVLSATNNAQVWAEMLATALEVRLRPEAHPEWRSIISQIGDTKARRNKLAHSQVMSVGLGGADGPDYDNCEPRVGLSVTQLLTGKGNYEKSLGVDDVRRLADDLQKLCESMAEFSRRVPALCQ